MRDGDGNDDQRATGRSCRVAGMLAVVVIAVGPLTACSHDAGPGPPVSDPRAAAGKVARAHAEEFFRDYVDDTGRVVRHDKGGDTVSEGQAYALLLAVAMRDRQLFRRVWVWTRDNLQRDDGLFSWLWRPEYVVDDRPATDADLDIARALILAGREFEDPEFTRAGERIGQGILAQETAVVAGRRVLLPGPWAKEQSPPMINVSYVSPVATAVLSKASGDPAWKDLEEGSRGMIATLHRDQLPPDWALLDGNGNLTPTAGGPSGLTGFGWDAVRVAMRHAESCVDADRDFAAGMTTLLAADASDVFQNPVGWVARAASYAAAGRPRDAERAFATAVAMRKDVESYYGDAWVALGGYLLLDGRLGGCPPDSALRPFRPRR